MRSTRFALRFPPVGILLLILAACSASDDGKSAAEKFGDGKSADSKSFTPVVPVAAPLHLLKPGDRLAIAVDGEAELNGQYPVQPDGMVAVPLIGSVDASGADVAEFGNRLRVRMMGALFKNPSVTVSLVEKPMPGAIPTLREIPESTASLSYGEAPRSYMPAPASLPVPESSVPASSVRASPAPISSASMSPAPKSSMPMVMTPASQTSASPAPTVPVPAMSKSASASPPPPLRQSETESAY